MTAPAALLPEFALASEVRALRREVAVLRVAIAEFATRRRALAAADARLGPLLTRIHHFAGASAWTAGELVADARRAAPELWTLLDELTGGRGDPAVRLGIWLRRHEGVAVDGLRLERVRVEAGCWTYRIVAVGE